MLKTKEQKDNFRKDIRSLRSSAEQSELQHKSKQIAEQCSNSPEFKVAKNIAIYHAVDGEADPEALTRTNNNTYDTSKNFYLPILAKDKSIGLRFAPINETTKYEPNKFLIPEPIFEESELLTGKQLDLVIVPLVGFDNKGNRIGMGGGFYDRTFSFKQTNNTRPSLMGFAFDFQQTESIHDESWDVQLDYIATETQLISTKKY